MIPRFVPYPLLLLLIAAAYFGAAEIGLSQAFLHANVSAVWPPTGVAIAAIWRLGYRISPAILFGAFLANLATGVSIATAGGIAAGNMLEAVSAVFLLHRFIGFRNPFYRAQDAIKFVLVTGAFSTIVSSTIGNVSLCLGGAAEWANFGPLWLTWWLGDEVGALVIAPLLLTWVEESSERWPPRRLAEAALLLLSLSVVASIFLGGLSLSRIVNYSLWCLIFAFLLWAAFRFGPRGVATTMALFSVIAVWGARQGLGPFTGDSLHESLLLLQIFMAAVAVTFLVLAAIITERKRAEQALAERLHEMETMMEMLPVGLFIAQDHAGARIVGNRAAREFLRMERIADTNLSLSAPPGEAPKHFKVLKGGQEVPPEELPVQRAVAEGVAVRNLELEVVFSDGVVKHELISALPLFDQNGAPRGAVASLMDITERKQAEEALRESQAQLASMIDSAMDAIITTDDDQRILIFNEAAEKMFGCSSEQAIGEPIDRFIPERFRGPHREHVRRFGETRVTRRAMGQLGNIFGLRADGREFPIEASISQVEVNGRNLYTVILRDITEQKQAEKEREHLLAREQEARARAEAANRAKDEFLATLSHELRTPLNAIVGWAEMLRQRQLDPPLISHAAEVISRNAKSQARLIEDILDVSRIVTGKFELDVRPVELLSIIHAVIDAVRPAAQAKEISLEKDLAAPACCMMADSTRLQQIVWNLLSNAIKFTPKGGMVEVKVRCVDSDAEIIISDNGQGISADFLPYIFDRFSQADSSRTRKHMGLGLGLAIARHLVELHGGAIEAVSAGEGQGSTFVVRLPLAAAGAGPQCFEQAVESRQMCADSPSVLEGLHVLLVDDHADTREMLSAILQMNGAEVRTSETAREAFEALQVWKPDVLVSDIGMPEEDGYSLIRKIRELRPENGGATPTLALTGYAGPEEGEQALQAGYNMYSSKPVEPDKLIEAIVALHKHSTKGKMA